LGYTVASKFFPNALLSSNLRAPVRYSRSFRFTSSSTYEPIERDSTSVSEASVLAAPLMVPDPAGRPRPVAKLPRARSRKNCPPTDVRDPTAGESWNLAEAPRSTEVCEMSNRFCIRTPARFSPKSATCPVGQNCTSVRFTTS